MNADAQTNLNPNVHTAKWRMKAFGITRNVISLVVSFILLHVTGCSFKERTVFPELAPRNVILAPTAHHNAQVRLVPKGIYALDQDTVFLFGDFRFRNGWGRSMLLQSSDKGRQWSEVMTPLLGSVVMAMAFADTHYGWALVMYSVESPGKISLFHSQNGGMTWSEQTTFENSMLGVPFEMNFYDRMNGQIVIEYALENRYAFIETTDGGFIWRETASLPLDQYQLNPAQPFSRGFDNGEWRYTIEGEALQPRQIVIWQRANKEDEWKLAVQLPERYDFIDGRVVTPQP